MTNNSTTVVAISLLALTGCTSHLIFVEEDHIGLKAAFEANNPAPAQISLGYRRGVVAVIPQQSDGSQPKIASATVSTTATAATNPAAADVPKTITITTNPNELMSLYTVFKANIGFGDPVRISHFLATGTAATSLLADHNELRNVTDTLKAASEKKGGGQ